MRGTDELTRIAFWTLVVVGLVGIVIGILLAAGVSADPAPALETGSGTSTGTSPTAANESAYVEPVPAPGDEYYEARASDDSWISYVNPRDEYRSPYAGHGSGKIGVILLNAEGEPVVGESVPDTTVTIPTGDSLEWHTSAAPFTVEFPLTTHYERPLDADQFGTNESLPQGDGYLDSHTMEWHGLSENATVKYGEANVSGDHADRIELVGYVQQAHRAWDSDVDPIEDAVSYEEAGGGWTYQTDSSHGQVIVVLQLVEESDAETNATGPADNRAGESPTTSHDEDDGTADTAPGDEPAQASESVNSTPDDDDRAADALPAFGFGAAIVGLLVVATARSR